MSVPDPTNLDFPQVLRGAYDETTGRLRVDSNATVVNADIDVSLDATEDNVAIRDGAGHELNVNPDGSINVVSTATDLDIRNLSATTDNIAISDGTDTLIINPDGSINTKSHLTATDDLPLTHSDSGSKKALDVNNINSLLSGIGYDDVQVSYPSTTVESYIFYLAGIQQASIEVTYATLHKRKLTRARRL